MEVRINKHIKDTGAMTRREADEMIKKGLVYINGKKAVLGDKVKETDTVEIHRKAKKKYVYIAYNKPKGVVSTNPQGDETSIEDIVTMTPRVFPVGRLDKESTGLILLTNDGRITDRLLNPASHYEKEYKVTIDRPFSPAFARHMREGVMVDGEKTKPALFKKIDDTTFSLTITEGRNRQIKKMVDALGYTVRELRRVRIEHIPLKNLPEGSYRPLTPEETSELLTRLGL